MVYILRYKLTLRVLTAALESTTVTPPFYHRDYTELVPQQDIPGYHHTQWTASIFRSFLRPPLPLLPGPMNSLNALGNRQVASLQADLSRMENGESGPSIQGGSGGRHVKLHLNPRGAATVDGVSLVLPTPLSCLPRHGLAAGCSRLLWPVRINVKLV